MLTWLWLVWSGGQLRSHVDWALQQLDPTERDIIRMTKGLDDGVRRKPRQVARMLELRTTQVRVDGGSRRAVVHGVSGCGLQLSPSAVLP